MAFRTNVYYRLAINLIFATLLPTNIYSPWAPIGPDLIIVETHPLQLQTSCLCPPRYPSVECPSQTGFPPDLLISNFHLCFKASSEAALSFRR